jgi:superfamily II DNA or RNA helicase
MESSVVVCGVPFRKKPRSGQERAISAAADPSRSILNVQLPTGYGKTLVANGVYSVLRHQGRANRMMIIFPTEAQHEQYVQSAASDLIDVGLEGERVADMRFLSASRILNAHRKNTASIFAITIQSLISRSGLDITARLMETGRWCVTIDEHHHYGEEAIWGKTVKQLSYQFLLAMSATPHRKDRDNAFGSPDIEVRYREAETEKAVKPLRGHAYHYRIDLIDKNGDIISMTPGEMVEEAGSPSQQALKRITREMRISPKYISPLVSEPLQRLLRDRLEFHPYLQAIIGCMWVDHAKSVCAQVRSMFPELRVDWVGTGPDGRDDNKAVIERFCPPKDPITGRRPSPELDVLVHVGMAGEGLDTILVSEIVHLNAATLSNQNNQENGRAARYMHGVTGNINFDSTTGYAIYTGPAIMDAMDMMPPSPDEEGDEPPSAEEGDYRELPEEPPIHIHDIQLDHIDSGHPDVQPMKLVLETHGTGAHIAGWTVDDIKDPSHPIHDAAIIAYRNMRAREASEHDTRAQEALMRKAINEAVGKVAGLVIKHHKQNGVAIERSMAGDIRRRISGKKVRALGKVDDADGLNELRAHYQWVRDLEQSILRGGLPAWLQ